MPQRIKVWDFVVRFFHWSQLLLLVALWYTGSEGYIVIHQLLAYVLAAIIIARLAWGVYGSQTARFSHFSATPAAALRYLRHTKPVVGHNPASFYMIITLILLVLLQLISGLATMDNSYMSDGPLVAMLPSAWVDTASWFHKLNVDLIMIAVAVHVLFAVWHSVRHDNVIKTLITGKGEYQTAVSAPKLSASWSYFVLVAVLLLLAYFWQGKTLLTLL